ncbi:hypothetical protein GCM10009557_66260 [Virgisporangium ochraceum]|uniref:Integral membrane protein n=1 Tax=Virgisporangium ochraceum TaxID=65505 RepID=A0A8J4EG95_9ACTN|nr:hypothetical protein Voc01_058190 [Virgisporangium ochraceum]
MTATGWVALGMALFGALSYGVGSILQAIGAMRSTSTVRTLGHPLYLLGVGCDLLAWGASMVALRELAVYQVQSILAGSLAVTVVAARLVLASRLRGRDVAAVMVTIAALTVLAMSAGPQEAVPPSGPLRLGFCVAAVAVAAGGWVATKVGSPGVVAALAGTAFGGAALSGRALPMPEESANTAAFLLALIMEPMTLALLVFAASGMLLYTNALQHGQVGPVTAVLWIGEVVAPSAVGLLLLGDSVRAGWQVPAALAGVVVIGAAVVLATAPASSTTSAETAVVPKPAAPVPALSAPLSAPLWPSLDASTQLRPFLDQESGVIRWWGPPVVDRYAGTFWWWGPPTSPQLVWVPAGRRVGTRFRGTARVPRPEAYF